MHADPVEPHVQQIQHYAPHGLSKTGHHGAVAAMGVPRQELPSWDDIQFVTAQLATAPRLDDEPVGTEVVVGPNAQKPLTLKIPLMVSDMSFGSLSEPAKVALARGAELAGTGIASGEGGMLAEEQAANSRYFYEYASARFGFAWEKVMRVQAFHFKGGQAAKTGTGGHLPARKNVGKIALTRGLPEGTDAISPARFPDWTEPKQIRAFADEVRSRTGGIPIGYKLSAQHIEKDIDAALEVGCDYVIVDGRGGATGAAPLIFRDHISVPTIPALARARAHLDKSGKDVTLIITGGLRTPADFAKALALGADAVAIANSAIQAIGCIGMRACHTNNCPVGIATQNPRLTARLDVDQVRRAAGALPGDVGRADEDPRARLRPHASQPALHRRSDDLEGGDGAPLRRALWRRRRALTKRQRAPGRCGSGSTDDRPDSAVPAVRSDGDVNSLDGATGGAAPGAALRSDGWAARASGTGRAGGAGRITRSALTPSGVDCARAGSDDATASTAPRTIGQDLTARSPVLYARPSSWSAAR